MMILPSLTGHCEASEVAYAKVTCDLNYAIIVCALVARKSEMRIQRKPNK